MPLDDSLHSSSGTMVDPVFDATHSAQIESRPGPTSRRVGKLAFALAFLAMGLAVLAIFAAILKINNGTFIYTLDDPYIHLALSDQIRHGNYGLYPGIHAAPSSSIAFPFVLAIAAGTALHPYLPLLINICALFFAAELIRRFMLHLKLGVDNFALVSQAAFLFLMALCFNMIGVVFTGLEHSLHIATVVAIVYGLVLFLDRGKLPAWLAAAIVLCPLIRYEGLALSVAALLVLALRGRWLTALATLTVIAALVGGFSVFLVKLGLPPLPSSILSKSAVAAGGVDGANGHFFTRLDANIHAVLLHPSGMALMLIGVVAACICANALFIAPRRWTPRSLMALVLLVSAVGHTFAGRFGWLDRYEDYVMVSTALISIYLAQSVIRGALAPGRRDRLVLVLGAAALLLVFSTRYWTMTLKARVASNNIYEQQLQMHRFVDGYYRGAVAINDLGLISYHNPYPVLDLGGLGSEKARRMIASDASAADYEAFVSANGVHLIMVYEEWFPGQIPETWQHVGTMTVSRELVSASRDDVQFYVTDDATAAKVRAELAAFRAVLPPRVDLTIY